MKVIGYEGARDRDSLMSYGAAGILHDDGRIENSCWGGPREYDEEERKELFESSAFEVLEVPIEVSEFPKDTFVLDLPTSLAKREPYVLEDDFHARCSWVIARSYGPERTYYLFESLERCSTWLSHLHLRGFVLVPEGSADPRIETLDLSGDGTGPWKLLVNGHGVANFPSEAVNGDPKSYVEEVVRVLKVALTGNKGA